MTSKDIRATFLNFFKERNHKIVPSAPMVVKDDPTLMFTNAGMNQFKEFFLGHSKSADPRIADTQKCLRVSGKHNDLEEVGKDTYHHTMFEMLGNWSFGDYFKKEAIGWAWELLTDVYKIDPDRLYATVFEGSSDADQLDMDREAAKLWEAYLPPSHILKGSKKDNFWEMGDQGPCGPCSEIHVDIRPQEARTKIPGAGLVNRDHPQVVEIWNLVFIQFNRKANGALEPLPERHVDTGMGFERLCMVLQGKESSYETDLFTPLIREIETITGSEYGKSTEQDIAIRVLADHIRAGAFAIADGQLPGNSGAGYVIRRIIRRAVRYGFTFLDQQEPFLYRLVRVLSETMGSAFPELRDQRQLLENVIREEEHSFLRTLEQGLGLLESIVKQAKGKTIDGRQAFELYDTFGFPIDLTSLILSEKGYTLDQEGFQAAMKEQQDRSRKASEVAREDWIQLKRTGKQEFVGYDELEAEVRLSKYRKVRSAKEGDRYQLVFSPTPFYPEGGGQVGDTGFLESADGDVVYILDTRKENNEIIHLAEALPRKPEKPLKACVDRQKRQLTARNHTATHLLHQALREILGPHVEQKGSAVHSGYLRFDFSHFSKLSEEEISRVEEFVNARISEHLPLVEHRNMPVREALEEGAIALFGEKYGDRVRTVRFGKSLELCGGTHVGNTAEIWHFKITSEGAIAAGVRRIEAITSDAVREYFMQHEKDLQAIRQLVKGAQDPVDAVLALQEENHRLKKELNHLQKDKIGHLKSELFSEFTEINGVKFLAREVDLDAAGIKDLAFELGNKADNLFLLLASKQDGKALLSCYVSKPLTSGKGLHAGHIVRELGALIGGGGGGQPFFATAGGKNPSGIPSALQKARDYLPGDQ